MLQLIALTTGYNLLTAYNKSIPTHDIPQLLHKFYDILGLTLQYEYSERNIMKANWTGKYEANFTKVYGPNGTCFTFNYPGAAKIFNFDE
jgi:hypothetical protein